MSFNFADYQPLFEDTFLADTCRITRDAEGVSDDTWNETTGTYTHPSPDTTTIYEGLCSVYLGQSGMEVVKGEQMYEEDIYWLETPVSTTAQLLPKDRVQILTSRDPEMLDKKFVVHSMVVSTHQVLRRTRMFVDTEQPT